MNKTIITGNLCSNPELRFIPSGTAVCEVSIANNRKFKDKEETIFIDVVIFGKQAENLHKYLEKGSKVLVEGRLTQDRWTDKTTQKPRTKLKLTAENVEFIGGKQREQSDDSSYQGQPTPEPPQGSGATCTGQDESGNIPF